MEEDIKILEQFLTGNKITCENCKEKCNECYIEYEEVQAVANLIKGYRELEERIIHLTNLLCINDSDENYIPKSKIKEKIEELDNASVKEEYVFYKLSSEDIRRTIKTVLQELMEEK